MELYLVTRDKYFDDLGEVFDIFYASRKVN